jgi:hypothetical protein
MLDEHDIVPDLAQRIDDIYDEIDSDVCVYLSRKDDDYIALHREHSELTSKFPFIERMTDGTVPASLNADEIAALARFMVLNHEMICAELKAMYYRGHADCLAYLRKFGAI